MELQMIEILAPKDFKQQHDLLEKFEYTDSWVTQGEEEIHIHILVEKPEAEEILNYLEQAAYDESNQFDALLYSVKAYIPSHLNEKNTPDDDQEQFERASRHELLSIVKTSGNIDASFTWFSIFAAVVAAAGIIQNSPALVLGANIIDPSIRPLMGASFSSLIGEKKLLRKSGIAALYGLFVAIATAALFGFLFPLPLESSEFLARTSVSLFNILVAIAAGAAGALSFVKRSQGQLVGVMISLSVLPPAVVLGMMAGAFEWQSAVQPLLLLVINVNSILLSAILVFWISGIKPINWKDIKDANTSRLHSLLFTGGICLILIVTVIFLKF